MDLNYKPMMFDMKGEACYKVTKPILFESPTYQYLRIGDVIGHCSDLGKKLMDEKYS